MTKKDFMYVVGMDDEEQLENIMLLCGEEEPQEWSELARKWFSDLREYANRLEKRYQ